MKTFICALCKMSHTINKTWTDQDKEREMISNFGKIPIEDREVVCDECYQKILEYKNRKETLQTKALLWMKRM